MNQCHYWSEVKIKGKIESNKFLHRFRFYGVCLWLRVVRKGRVSRRKECRSFFREEADDIRWKGLTSAQWNPGRIFYLLLVEQQRQTYSYCEMEKYAVQHTMEYFFHANMVENKNNEELLFTHILLDGKKYTFEWWLMMDCYGKWFPFWNWPPTPPEWNHERFACKSTLSCDSVHAIIFPCVCVSFA